MSQAVPESPVAKPRKSRRFVEYIVILFIIVAVIGVAFYQDEIHYFLNLKMWNKSAPGDTVLAFLSAGKSGDRKTADSYLGSKDYQPFTKDGKWQGYFVALPSGSKLFFIFDKLTPADAKVTDTEFVLRGNGAVLVTVPDSKGVPEKYRLIMESGGWKITELLGGESGR
jgi:hypothetical protein